MIEWVLDYMKIWRKKLEKSTCCLLNQGNAIIWKFKWVIIRSIDGAINDWFVVPNGKCGEVSEFILNSFLGT